METLPTGSLEHNKPCCMIKFCTSGVYDEEFRARNPEHKGGVWYKDLVPESLTFLVSKATLIRCQL
jgi:hypothetical protein